MDKQHLLEKKTSYEMLRVELLSKTYEDEIEAEVAKERARIEAKYDEQKQRDVAKVDHYIELLGELVIEATKEEALKLAEEVESSQCFTSAAD